MNTDENKKEVTQSDWDSLYNQMQFISKDGQFMGVQFHPEVYAVIEHFYTGLQEGIKAIGIYQLFFSKILKNCAPRV